jgi:hypothetical protein
MPYLPPFCPVLMLYLPPLLYCTVLHCTICTVPPVLCRTVWEQSPLLALACALFKVPTPPMPYLPPFCPALYWTACTVLPVLYRAACTVSYCVDAEHAH